MAGQRDRLGRVGRAIDHGDRRIRAVARHVDAVAARVHGERPDAAGYRDGGGRGRRIREVDDAHVVRAAVGDVELVGRGIERHERRKRPAVADGKPGVAGSVDQGDLARRPEAKHRDDVGGDIGCHRPRAADGEVRAHRERRAVDHRERRVARVAHIDPVRGGIHGEPPGPAADANRRDAVAALEDGDDAVGIVGDVRAPVHHVECDARPAGARNGGGNLRGRADREKHEQ